MTTLGRHVITRSVMTTLLGMCMQSGDFFHKVGAVKTVDFFGLSRPEGQRREAFSVATLTK
jgi:hypothetical protein